MKKIIALMLIICGLIFYNSHLNNIQTLKPLLKVGIINFPKKMEGHMLVIPALTEILNEQYRVKIVKSGYDLLISGFLNKDPIPTDDNIIKIYYTSEVFLGDIKQRLQDHDLVMGFDFIDHPNYIRHPFSYTRYASKIRHDYVRNQTCAPNEKKYFACFLVKNYGYSAHHFNGAHARIQLFHQLSLYKFVASGGKHLNNIGASVPYHETEKWLSECKFTIAYENDISHPGNVTEKPFQPWFAGSIPIYNTHPQGMTDINKRAVIYAQDFVSDNDLIEYIKKVDNDNKLYCEIQNQPIINDPNKDYSVLKRQISSKLNEIFAKKYNRK